MRVMAAIVTFQPDLDRLVENLQAVAPQVAGVIVVDNGSSNIADVRNLVEGLPKAVLLEQGQNSGIAAALNVGLRGAKSLGASWALTLDQDSVCPEGMVDTLARIAQKIPDAGIVAPTIRDVNLGTVGHHPTSEFKRVRTCITSGALTSVDAWDAVGGFDESMFIDSVDFDFCYTLEEHGYGVYQTSCATLQHEIGHGETRRFLVFRVRVMNHSAFRKFYIARNNIYLPLKHGYPLRTARGAGRDLLVLAEALLFEDDKAAKAKAIASGACEGLSAGLEALPRKRRRGRC